MNLKTSPLCNNNESCSKVYNSLSALDFQPIEQQKLFLRNRTLPSQLLHERFNIENTFFAKENLSFGFVNLIIKLYEVSLRYASFETIFYIKFRSNWSFSVITQDYLKLGRSLGWNFKPFLEFCRIFSFNGNLTREL